MNDTDRAHAYLDGLPHLRKLAADCPPGEAWIIGQVMGAHAAGAQEERMAILTMPSCPDELRRAVLVRALGADVFAPATALDRRPAGR